MAAVCASQSRPVRFSRSSQMASKVRAVVQRGQQAAQQPAEQRMNRSVQFVCQYWRLALARGRSRAGSGMFDHGMCEVAYTRPTDAKAGEPARRTHGQVLEASK